MTGTLPNPEALSSSDLEVWKFLDTCSERQTASISLRDFPADAPARDGLEFDDLSQGALVFAQIQDRIAVRGHISVVSENALTLPQNAVVILERKKVSDESDSTRARRIASVQSVADKWVHQQIESIARKYASACWKATKLPWFAKSIPGIIAANETALEEAKAKSAARLPIEEELGSTEDLVEIPALRAHEVEVLGAGEFVCLHPTPLHQLLCFFHRKAPLIKARKPRHFSTPAPKLPHRHTARRPPKSALTTARAAQPLPLHPK